MTIEVKAFNEALGLGLDINDTSRARAKFCNPPSRENGALVIFMLVFRRM